jgi:hypothetical protein
MARSTKSERRLRIDEIAQRRSPASLEDISFAVRADIADAQHALRDTDEDEVDDEPEED